MLLKFTLTLLLFFNAATSFGQDSAHLSKKNTRSNIAIISRDGLTINGCVMEITLDYILLDARDLNSPVNLSAYYIRPSGNYFRIDVEYIQAAVLRAKKKTGQSAMAGAVSGALIGGEVVNDGDASLSTIAGASGAGLAIGGLVGTAKGLGRKKVVVPIYGNSEKLISLLKYYQ